MNLLLDTHVLLWIAAGSGELGPRAAAAIAEGHRCVFVSAVTAWEITIKAALGRIDAPRDYLEMLDHYRFTPLDVTTAHALAVRDLPLHHRDPFDRMLVAQARLEGLALVTGNAHLAAYDLRLVGARS
ncbi:MAG: type II toxin-antitoxin system VapC family toxin [Trueperaceae bacterium]|nr:type II toxin-antitoxin system VapC family toxin [Trueperaceae bacterium]